MTYSDTETTARSTFSRYVTAATDYMEPPGKLNVNRELKPASSTLTKNTEKFWTRNYFRFCPRKCDIFYIFENDFEVEVQFGQKTESSIFNQKFDFLTKFKFSVKIESWAIPSKLDIYFL